MEVKPFKIDVPDAVLADLQDRLDRSRLAADFGNDDWRYGFNGDYLRELVDHWRTDYDWRAHEKAMNAFPHFRTEIDGVPIHFIHVKGKGPNPTPLILTHGWPWTFWDYRELIGPLSDPAAYGGDPADAFDIVIPSLPGYGFSSPLDKTGINFWRTADLWVKLMEGLGYPRFASHGEDWGAFITAQLGHKYADRLIGVHLTTMFPLDMFAGGEVEPLHGEGEESWAQKNADFFTHESGYFQIQATKPQTLAYAMQDSPVGLCAWLVEKRRTWGHTRGEIESRFSKDDMLTTVMLYWVTDSFGTSARYYYEAVHNLWAPSHDRRPVVEAPTGIAVFLEELVLQPRRWAERYYNLKQWTIYSEGGHFAAFEEPATVVEDIRRFFRSLPR
ncbi:MULTISPECIES: epoxide hydrolase family protein [unclassified Sphingomonas]|uniref:epoxide hydrolase family protein n=1 Tax=unclassified Sphingomonas TaxID=196159 RepID=UPI0006F52C82|nr:MULTISPECIES: epoxide hydrolase family protein [unclassified Sphingomonas]KQX22634.1 epoxide hydrolase [Sphingomonas sp. Root1294]KQY67887.1 epoxide hydrolase [Sphingomonas sp. Root50]KRB88811.1 epoxide hydrolase [Sphingomonas sp. Root720]